MLATFYTHPLSVSRVAGLNPGTSHSDLLRVIGHPARAERDEAKSPEEIVRTGYVPRGIGEIGENGARQSS